MRIALDLQACQTSSRHRGIGRYSLSMARALIRNSQGHDCFVILNNHYAAEAAEIRTALSDLLTQSRIVTISVPGGIATAHHANAWRARAAQAVYEEAIRALGIDLVFCPSPFENMKADVVVPSSRTTPLFVTVHDLIPLTAPDIYLPDVGERNAYFGQLAALRQADGLIAVSAFTKAEAERYLDVEPDRITHAALGAAEIFKPLEITPVAKDALLSKYGITDRFVIITAPYEERKNIHGVLAAYAAVDTAVRDDLQIVFAGFIREDGQNKMRKMAREEGLKPHELVLAGYVPDSDLAALYSLCELMVFPSLSEGFGLPPLEAMACGAIVVGSNTTSIPEVIDNPQARFDPADIHDMAATIERALTDAPLRKRLKTWGKKRAADFSWDLSAKKVLKAFEASIPTARPRRLTAEVAEKRRIGIMAAVEYAEGRQAYVLSRLLADLGANHEIFLCLRGAEPIDPLIQASTELRSEAWFQHNGGSLDAMIYVADARRVHEFRQWHAVRPGVFILLDDFLPLQHAGNGATIPGDLQTALYAEAGMAGLADHVAQNGRSVRYRAGQSLVGLDTIVLAGTEDKVAEGLTIVRTPPLTASITSFAGEALRDRFRIPRGVQIVLASAANRDVAALVAQSFRSLRRKDAVLILGFEDEAEEVLPVGEAADRIGVNVGGIIRVASEIRRHYGAYMAAATVVLVAGDAADPTTRGLIVDAEHFGKPLIVAPGQERRGTTLAPPAIAAALSQALGKADPRLEATQAGRDASVRVARATDTSVALRILLAKAPRPARHAELALDLPANVGGVVPDEADVARVVQSVTANSELSRTPKTFIDISAFAAPGAASKPDRAVRRLLSALLSKGRAGIEPVCLTRERYVSARYYASKLLGVRNPALADTPVHFRPADRLVAIDVMGALPTTGTILAAAQARGVVLASISTSRLLTLRPDLTSSLAAAAWEALEGLNEPMISTVRTSADDRTSEKRDDGRPASAPDGPETGVQYIVLGEASSAPQLPTELGSLSNLRDLAGPEAANLRRQLILPSPPSATDHITIMGHILGSYSLAMVNRAISQVLDSYMPGRISFNPFETLPVTDLTEVPEDERPKMQTLVNNRVPDNVRSIVISQHYPIMSAPGDADMKIALFAWEETHLPPDTVDHLNDNFDIVLAQVESTRKTFIDSGIYRPVPLVGLPVDVSYYRGIDRNPCTDGVTTFLHVSSCFPRKGVDVLLAAWGEAFTKSDPVRLVIKTFPNPHNDIEDRIKALRLQYPQCAEIVVINRDMDKEALADLYRTASVMVLPTRGEGYNLPALEAMIAGLPLIVTAHGGHRDFCGPDDARLIDYQFEKSGSHVRKGISLWATPNRDDLVAALREQIDPGRADEIERRRNKAIGSAETAIEPEAWVRRLREAIQSITDLPESRRPKTGWVTTWDVQCGIAQYSNFILEQLPSAVLADTLVLSDARTPAGHGRLVRHVPSWTLGQHQKVEQLLQSIEDEQLDAVVIQHQDGLITWPDLGVLLNDPRVYERICIITLHIAGNLSRLLDHELRPVLDGLRKCARVLVHNVADLNLLKTFGLVDNVAVLPHGAIAHGSPPLVRDLGANAAPVIGSHGFFFQHKGLDKLIRAAAILREDWPNLRVRLVNARFPGGASDPAIQAAHIAAEETGMTDAIDWHLDFMAVEEIRDLLRGCDVLALPYEESDDSASGAVRVAMSSLVPLVVTDVKIFAEIGDSVAKAASNTPEIMAGTLKDLLASSRRRVEVQTSMQDWLQAHDWRRIARTMDGMIRGLMDARVRGWTE